MNRSTIIAATILVVIVGYFGLRSLMRGSISSHKEEAAIERSDDVPSAVIETLSAEPHMLRLSTKGRTEPDKSVTVKAGTTGTVVSTPAREGSFVKAGTLLCSLDVEARSARVKEAEAQRDSAVSAMEPPPASSENRSMYQLRTSEHHRCTATYVCIDRCTLRTLASICIDRCTLRTLALDERA